MIRASMWFSSSHVANTVAWSVFAFHPRVFMVGAAIFVVIGLQNFGFAGEESSFTEIAKRHFSAWSRNAAVLSPERVNQLVNNHTIKGEEAAAIAAIHCYQRKLKGEAVPVTFQFLTAIRQEDGSLRRDQAAVGKNLSLNYKGFLKHIHHVPRKLFAVEKPMLAGIKQGHLGDCYFVCGVGAVVHRNPGHITSLFHSNSDGSYDLLFPSRGKVHVTAPTDAQIALGSNAGEQGLWLNILEIAAGEVEEEHAHTKELGLDRLGEGGDSVFTIELLTGNKAMKERLRIAVNGQSRAPEVTDVNRLTAKVSDEIRNALTHGRLVCCGIGTWQTPPGMVSHHQYAVLGIGSRDVQIWNPWGGDYHFEPKGSPGMQHGYPTQHGHFAMPIDDFVRVFGSVNIETAEPLLR